MVAFAIGLSQSMFSNVFRLRWTPLLNRAPATSDIFLAVALLTKARQSADGAPGLDRWAGGEVEHWCIEIWEVYLQLLHRWADRGQRMRQIHIQKDETVYEGGACRECLCFSTRSLPVGDVQGL